MMIGLIDSTFGHFGDWSESTAFYEDGNSTWPLGAETRQSSSMSFLQCESLMFLLYQPLSLPSDGEHCLLKKPQAKHNPGFTPGTYDYFDLHQDCQHPPYFVQLRLCELRLPGFIPVAQKQGQFCWMIGFRVGEAQNPGPISKTTATRVRITTLNPTAIFRKESVLTDIGHEVYLLSENSATSTVQAKMTHILRQCGMQSLWGSPAPPHRVDAEADADNEYIRGAPVGVSIHAVFPLIPTRTEAELEWVQVGRLLRGYVQIGAWQIQLIVIYGLQASQPSARPRTEQLLQAAARMALEVNIPTVIGGDLNHRPEQFETWKILREHGWAHAGQLHETLYGAPLPPTYQHATSPDMLMISPHLLPYVKKVTVDSSGWVAGHHPLTAELQLPITTPMKTTWRLPKSWIPYGPEQPRFDKHYMRQTFQPEEFERAKTAPTWGLQTWAKKVEKAVHFAIAEHHEIDPLRQPFHGLPKGAQGRCRIPKIVQTPIQSPIKRAWDGHWTPNIDYGSILVKQHVKQLRRVQSLKFRVRKLKDFVEIWSTTRLQHAEEWRAILKAPGFYRGFGHWLQQKPELQDIGNAVPTEEQLFDIEQLLKYELQTLSAAERKQQRELHQYHRWFDGRMGNKKELFKTVREKSNGVISHLVVTQQTSAITTSNEGMGLVQMKLEQPLQLRPDLPLKVNGTQAWAIQFDFPNLEVMIEDADTYLPDKVLLSQEQPTAEPVQVGKALTEYWNRYWRRDSRQEQHHIDEWHEFQSLFEQLPPPERLTTEQLDLPTWREAICSVSSTSSRGICGWYPDELKMVASCEQALSDFSQLMQQMVTMPSWIMQARIIPVQKHYEADSPSQIRPITVFPLVYRAWGRAVARLILRQWTTHWPGDITGFLPSRSPEHIVYHLQFLLECRHTDHHSQEYGGLTLDLVKCFNQLPHRPIQELMRVFGVPDWAIQFWYQAITPMSRWWQIQGSMVPVGLGTTGLAEGDPMSVLGQLCLNRFWVFFLQHRGMIINAYADNWSYTTVSVRQHRGALNATQKVTKALKLEIDWKKTWCWGTDKAHVQALKLAASHFLPGDVQLMQASNARELGYILHYRKLHFRGTQKQRHAQSLARLKKLERQDAPILAVAQVAQQSAITKALFGVHLYIPAEKYFTELRSAIAHTMIPGSNVNPYLPLLVLTEKVKDPELYTIQQAIRAARRYLTNVNEELRTRFLRLASQRPKEGNEIFGPATALRNYLARIGWTLNSHGQLHVEEFLMLSLQFEDLKTLLYYSEIAWAKHVAERLTRANWRNAPAADFVTTRQLFKKFDEKDQKILAREICGGFLYQNQKQKFDSTITDACPLCQQPDNAEHRILHCTATQDIRDQHQWVVEQLHEFDPIHLHLPICFDDHMHGLLRVWQHQDMNLTWTDHPRCNSGKRRFFTDGSCMFPRSPGHRWAAFSIVEQVAPLTPQDARQFIQNPDEPVHLKIAAIGHCPGRQTIPRAELEAIIQITIRCPDAEIFTDSVYAMTQMQIFETMPPWSELAGKPGTDQLRRLFELRQRGSDWPIVRKVKAHQNLRNCDDELELEFAIGNTYADQVAKAAALQLGGPLLAHKRRLLAEHDEMKEFLVASWALRLDQGKMRSQLIHAEEQTPVQPGMINSILEKFSQWPEPSPCQLFRDAVWDERHFQASYWGPTFSQLVWLWLRELKWPTQQADTVRKTPIGITWIELAINCWLCTQHSIPVNINKYPAAPHYVSTEENPGFSLTQTTMLAMADSLSKCVRQLAKFNPEKLMPLEHSRTVRSLQALAGTSHHYGISIRPWMPLQHQTMTILHTWLRSERPDPLPEVPNTERPHVQIQVQLQRLNPAARNTLYQTLLRTRRKDRIPT